MRDRQTEKERKRKLGLEGLKDTEIKLIMYLVAQVYNSCCLVE